MADATGDDVPRLPPRPAHDPASEQLALDFRVAAPRPPGAHLSLDWPDFEEPALLSLKGTRLAVVLARVVALGWSLAAVVFALRIRSDSSRTTSTPSLLLAGLVVACVVAVTGWIWSDQVTRNLHRLGGRLPNRGRCLSAWSLPIAWAILLSFTVLRMEPTDVFDVRPMIVVSLMALTIWRPYALIRRILNTLTRVRSDAPLGAGYVLDLSAFGLLWWQLSASPASSEHVGAGQADVLLGVSAAAAVAFGINIATWAWIVHDVDIAQADRLLALRTRHDHRHLRLRGINPMDPDVRWALLRIRQEEELERRIGEERAHEAPSVATPQPKTSSDSIVEASPDALWIRPPEPVASVVDETAGDEPIPSEPILDQPIPSSRGIDAGQSPTGPVAEPDGPEPEIGEPRTTEPPTDVPVTPLVAEILESEAGELIIADLVGEIASTEVSAQLIADLADEVAAETPQEIVDDPVAPVRDALIDADVPVEIDTGTAGDHETESRDGSPGSDPSAELAARLRARLRSGRDHTTSSRSYPTIQPADREDSISRLARRLDSSGATTASRSSLSPTERLAAATAAGVSSEDLESRRERIAQRLNDSAGSGRSERTLLQRLEEYGITPTATGGEPVGPIADEFRHDVDRWIPPRLYELEAVRYLLLIGLGVVALTSGWIVTRTVTTGNELVGGDIASVDLDRINVARRAFVTALAAALALVALWSAVFLSHARRAGAPDPREWRGYTLLVIVAALNIVSFVLDGNERGRLSLLCLLGCLTASCLAVACVAPIVRWFERRTLALIVWTAGLVIVTVISWLGGLQQPIEPNDALEALTFVAAVQAIGAAICVVIAAVSTSDIEDAIRLSPAMAQTLEPAHHRETSANETA